MELPHEMILASAGSGKTWQLTNRYVSLMALQLRSGQEVAPERILAATFTVKAAGEFFEAILVKLAEAASDPKAAAALAAVPDDPLSPHLAALEASDYLVLLRAFVARMPRLFLGTLDSFFANVLRSFPAEFGLPGNFEVMDEFRSAMARAEVCDAVFSLPRRGSREAEGQSAFLEAFRLATLGSEENRVAQVFDGFIGKLHELYLTAPSPDRWGRAGAIWPDGGMHWLAEGIEPEKEGRRLLAALRAAEASGDKIEWKWWDPFFPALADHRPGLPLSKPIIYVAERVLPVWREVLAGAAGVKFNRTVQRLGPAACDPLRRIFQWLIGGELKSKLDRTRGVGELVALYESAYANRIRRRGWLTFQDVQLLLSGTGTEEGKDAPVFTQLPSSEERLRIDYRLDARYDHWLLDEFQDTNMLQWRVIANLVDEVMQDTSGTRSLFQVGDLKQAIYAWRGGDTRLFKGIAARYNAHGERLRQRHLDVSWRSGHDVIDPVNQVFGDKAALEALGLPAPAIAQWEWNDHRVSPRGEDYEGCTLLLQPVGPDGEKANQDDVHRLVAAVLEEIDPVVRGISCAVLVQRNKEGEALVDSLRTLTDIPVMSESEIAIASDNPLNRALTSLFQVAAHPGDRFAWEHLRMGPLEALLSGDTTPGAFSRRLLGELFESGFERVARDWTARIEEALGSALDAFTRGRAEEFALAARHFDETGSRDIDAFLAFLKSHRIREAAATDAVQVMTIHKSKGLTFDAVILAELGGNSLDTARTEIGAKRNAEREVEWVLELPRKDFVAADPVLAAYAAEREAEAAYEALCKFYVAMTRASRANYLIVEPPTPNSRARNFVKLLVDTLGGEPEPIEVGGVSAELLHASETPRSNRRWYESFSRREQPVPAFSAEGVDPARARSRLQRRTPSGSEGGTVTADQVFNPAGGAARNFGNGVHAIFESVEWLDENGAFELPSGGEGEGAGSVEAEALAHVREVLGDPVARAAFFRPSPDAEVWRERSFEIQLGHEWLSGTFDRVVVERDATGTATRAEILDFKTDRVFSPEEIDAAVDKYRPQLATYREVLRRMTGLESEAIRCRLLFTRSRTLREI